jgi:hypothetical protein
VENLKHTFRADNWQDPQNGVCYHCDIFDEFGDFQGRARQNYNEGFLRWENNLFPVEDCVNWPAPRYLLADLLRFSVYDGKQAVQFRAVKDCMGHMIPATPKEAEFVTVYAGEPDPDTGRIWFHALVDLPATPEVIAAVQQLREALRVSHPSFDPH